LPEDEGSFRGFKKFSGGKELPPHPDWVKNVVLPNLERGLVRAEKLLARLMDEQ